MKKLTQGYTVFREKYASTEHPIMQALAKHGQHPEVMAISCCDSRVDPALILQVDPGDIFTVRSIANIVAPYRTGQRNGTGAALEYGICYLNVKHLIILAHSQCGGINALLNTQDLKQDDFISDWMSSNNIDMDKLTNCNQDQAAQKVLLQSYNNCLGYPWIKQRIEAKQLAIHLWFIDIESADILNYDFEKQEYTALVTGT